MSFDNAYEALGEYSDDTRWAFGTGFAEPLAGVDTSLPSGVDGELLAQYCLMLGDDALIMSHRLQEWVTNAPELEDEVALANIGLDLIGQARLLYARAGKADGTDRGEDRYAFFRDEAEFRNVRLVETPNGDFAYSMARLLVFATWRLALLHRLTASADQVLAAIAAKGVKEVTYHRDYAANWVVRLGDGTERSHERMQSGLDSVWPLVGELFVPHSIETRLSGVAVDPAALLAEFDEVLTQVIDTATLRRPQAAPLGGVSGRMGRDGVHTEAFGFVIAELQSVARAHPEATW
ncbi:MAG TPA: 1,2-phenylacetyl-CoA epoxidase subunit PaaC [Pseudonocardiaceae bacterium]|jgi:ring-1,2-phenylacetyl-CoA epoxidase subunit PaaC|nr:1,2-phenylacetyl-CoA epoxidase subunit PaaC [Pseudonocardiaceae bacterium]